MAGAIHRILLGNQEAAATWLPFAMGQFYACPEGAQTSFTPVPGVTILVKRVGGQDVVQITAGGSPDWVLFDNFNPTTAIGPPLVFSPNNPIMEPKEPSNSNAAICNIGGGKLFTTHGIGLQNDPDLTKPYVEKLTVWNWTGQWYVPISSKEVITSPSQGFFTRPLTIPIDTMREVVAGGPRVHRLVAIRGPDHFVTPTDPGAILVSDDLGVTWDQYAYPIAPVGGSFWFTARLERIDVDTLMWSVLLGPRGWGAIEPPVYTLRGINGGLGWAAQWSIYEESNTFQSPALAVYPIDAMFYPCKTPGEAIGLAQILLRYPTSYGYKMVLRVMKTYDSGVTFSHYDVLIADYAESNPLPGIPVGVYGQNTSLLSNGIWFDETSDTYAMYLYQGRPLGYTTGIPFMVFMLTSKDEGETWEVHPGYEFPQPTHGPNSPQFSMRGQGFYQGRFYVTFFGEATFSYSTADFGETWTRHPHSDISGKHTANVVQLFPSGKAFPHRDDM